MRQGALLSPLLFNIVIDWVLRTSLSANDGVLCLSNGQKVADLEYADDIALIAETELELQDMMNRLVSTAAKVGLRINAGETEVMYTGSTPPQITIGNHILKSVDNFKYLGCYITPDADHSKEVSVRIVKAQAAFAALQKDLWKQREVNKRVKLQVYLSVVRSTLLYGCETWPLKADDIRRLEAFEYRCFRSILKLRWDQRITNRAVLEKIGNPTELRDSIAKRRLRWLGHVLRMDDSRHPKGCFQFDPAVSHNWRRPPGGVRLSWKARVKKDLEPKLKKIYSRVTSWHKNWMKIAEDVAGDRPQWKSITEG